MTDRDGCFSSETIHKRRTRHITAIRIQCHHGYFAEAYDKVKQRCDETGCPQIYNEFYFMSGKCHSGNSGGKNTKCHGCLRAQRCSRGGGKEHFQF